MKQPTKVRIAVFLSRRQRTGLRRLAQRDGVVAAESIRRAIDAHLKRKGIRISDEDVAEDEKNITKGRA